MADISTAVSMARVPILGEDGRISDDYIPAAIGENVTKAESAATRAETAATAAEGSATAAGTSATKAQESATAAGNAKTAADTAQKGAESAKTEAEAAKEAAEAAKTGAETAKDSAQTAATKAQESATAAEESAASVADKFISSAQAMTLEPGSEATASVADQVLTLGIPRGDKGDKGDTGEKGDPGDVSAVTAAEGSDLSVSTDAGTVTIDDSALRARIEDLENASRNVVTGTSTGLVSHGEDAYAQKPREVRVKGKTWVNRWPEFSGTSKGVTVSTDETGLITFSGTPTDSGQIGPFDVLGIGKNKQYTLALSKAVTGLRVLVNNVKTDGSPSGRLFDTTTTTTSTSDNDPDIVEYRAYLLFDQTFTAGSLRIMLVDGTEAPDCFTPCASITSVQPENLVTSGKNLLRLNPDLAQTTVRGVTFTPQEDGSILVNGTNDGSDASYFNLDFLGNAPTSAHVDITTLVGSYIVASGNAGGVNITTGFLSKDGHMNYVGSSFNGNAFKVPAGALAFRTFLSVIAGQTVNNVTVYPQIELGTTATPYEPPAVTTIPLPEVELRSLPNGTCDELVIKADGSCEVERKLAKKNIDAEHPITVGIFIPASGTDLPWASVSYLFEPFDRHGSGIDKIVHSTSWPYTENLKSRGVYRTWNSTIFVDERFADKETAQSIINETGGTFIARVPMSTEPQSPVTLPTLPAPTFNVYNDSQVPSDTSVEYVRDINIVLDNLAKKVTGTASAVAVREASTIEKE